MEASDIHRLDATTVERIAAGEVVERPASAVKELVENSLDADASRIDVEVEAGGTSGIRVADDGVGMTGAAVRRAVEQHTTSKIATIDDLEAGVGTLGFRGEALHTIGAVSRTTVTTRPGDGGAAGTELRLEGGEVTGVGPAGRPPGTTVEVRDLFYNTPARRKYLKADATEFAHVSRVVTRYALANPDVAVSLTHDGTETFATTGQGDLREALLSVYGREVAESMVEVSADEATPADSPVTAVEGYVSHPETTRSTREYLSTYVNGRYVSEPTLRGAVLDAYGNQLAADRFPFAVLFVDLPGDAVDVNVHPRKMEVRFGDEDGVTTAVRTAVEDALLSAGLVRTAAPRGRSAPSEARVEPGEVDRADPGRSVGDGEAKPDDDTRDDGEPASGASSSATDAGAPSKPVSAADPDRSPGSDDPRERARTNDRDRRSGTDDRRSGIDLARVERPPGPDRKFAGPAESATLTGDEVDPEFERLPPLRVLGQLHDTYVVAEAPDGLVLLDQHAADERINYERLAADLADGGGSQALVSPVELELTAGEAAVFDDALADLRALGFDARLATDGRTAVVEAVPAVLSETLDPALLRDVLGEFVAGGDGDRAVESAADALLADVACYPSVTGNTPLSEGSVVELLAALDDCENPYACPHGRPVMIEVSEGELADRFERDYPGHAVRRPEE